MDSWQILACALPGGTPEAVAPLHTFEKQVLIPPLVLLPSLGLVSKARYRDGKPPAILPDPPDSTTNARVLVRHLPGDSGKFQKRLVGIFFFFFFHSYPTSGSSPKLPVAKHDGAERRDSQRQWQPPPPGCRVSSSAFNSRQETSDSPGDQRSHRQRFFFFSCCQVPMANMVLLTSFDTVPLHSPKPPIRR